MVRNAEAFAKGALRYDTLYTCGCWCVVNFIKKKKKLSTLHHGVFFVFRTRQRRWVYCVLRKRSVVSTVKRFSAELQYPPIQIYRLHIRPFLVRLSVGFCFCQTSFGYFRSLNGSKRIVLSISKDPKI